MKSKLPERNCDVCRKSGMEKLSPFLWQCRNPECNAFYHAAIRKCIVHNNSVDPKYLEWMRENRESFQLKWKDGKQEGYPSQIDIILDMKAMFPELTPCAGVAKFLNSQYREYWKPHYWLCDKDGNVIDPAQLENEAIMDYWDHKKIVLVCHACGEWIYNTHEAITLQKKGKAIIKIEEIFCSPECERKYFDFIKKVDSTQ